MSSRHAQNQSRDTTLGEKKIKDEMKGRQKQQGRQERLGIDYRLLWSCQEETCSTAAYFAFV